MTKREIIDILAAGGITPVAVDPAPIFDLGVLPPLIIGEGWDIELDYDFQIDEAIELLRGHPESEHIFYSVVEETWFQGMGDPALN